MIICAGNNEIFSFAKPVGVGLVNASIGLTKLLLTKPADRLLFVGTAGSYGAHKLFDIVVSSAATNVEIGFLEHLSYSPVLEQICSKSAKVSHETSPKTVVNSSSFITTDKRQAKLFLEYGLSIENMEFFAVLKAAREFDIPIIGLFCVTNFCDKSAHEEFIKNSTKAKQLLENAVLSDYKEHL